MSNLKQLKDENSPFRIRYSYELNLAFLIDEVPEQCRDILYSQLVEDFKIEIKSRIYKIPKEVLLK